jgi:carbonic anhydrase
MESYKRLLLNNQAWVADKLALRPDFFTRTSGVQKPEYLWIGCSDSRVPAEEVTGVEPGELFVHRNIANLVVHTDFNMLSVVQYAVEVLKVKHIIVCGHYGCGGVKRRCRTSTWADQQVAAHIKDVYRLHAQRARCDAGRRARYERLIELNVIEQVHHLAELSFVQLAWKREQRPTLHGWIYDIHTGLLKQIAKVDPGHLPHDIFVYEFPDARLVQLAAVEPGGPLVPALRAQPPLFVADRDLVPADDLDVPRQEDRRLDVQADRAAVRSADPRGEFGDQ